MSSSAVRTVSSRRRFIAGMAAPVALGLAARPALAVVPRRQVALHNLHTDEIVRTVYFEDGRYLERGLVKINHVLRDWRTNEVIEMDPKVLNILYRLQRGLNPKGPIEVVCGYRSPATNAMLRRRSSAVAKNSLHMYGMAVDFRLPEVSLRRLHAAAVRLKAGGVGYYPRSNFIHVDCGPVRYWGQSA